MQPNCLTALLTWPIRRWVAAIAVGIGTYFLLGIPTVVVENNIFGREIGLTTWTIPVLVVTSVLSGLLFATYIRVGNVPTTEREAKIGSLGGFFSFLAIGCPVCNKLALIALGYSGAIQYFAPIQPYLAALGIGLLAYALRQRLTNEASCKIPVKVNKVETKINEHN